MGKKVTVELKYFEFDQNNSGGSFEINDAKGIGPRVYIEAMDKDHACRRAEEIGIYFNGVDEGMDCACCGDRWYPPYDDGADLPHLTDYSFSWYNKVFVHTLDDGIKAIHKSEYERAKNGDPVLAEKARIGYDG